MMKSFTVVFALLNSARMMSTVLCDLFLESSTKIGIKTKLKSRILHKVSKNFSLDFNK